MCLLTVKVQGRLGNLINHSGHFSSRSEDIKRDLDAWESSGQWIFSAYCVSKDTSNATGIPFLYNA